eukprot:2846271-Amphidinium_carterae.1
MVLLEGIDYDVNCSAQLQERLLIFGENPGSKTGEGGRMHAERKINEMVQVLRLAIACPCDQCY